MRLLDSLFKPSVLGKYLADKVWRVVLYFVIFLLLCATPSIIKIINTSDVSYSDELVLFQSIYNDPTTDIKIVDNKLQTTTQKVYSDGSNFSVAFNTQDTTTVLTIAFYEEYFTVLYGSGSSKSELKKEMYSSLTDSSLDLTLIANKGYGYFYQNYKLLDYINIGWNRYLDIAIPQSVMSNVLYLCVEFLVVFVVLLFVGLYSNPFLPRKIRARIAVYCLTWSFVLYLFGMLVDISYLFYLGVFVSAIFMRIACSNIVRVKKI